MPSFDVVCEVDSHEVDNAVNQAKKEVQQRYDFRGSNTEIDRSDEGILIKSASQALVIAALKVLQEKMAKRQVSLKSLDPQPAEAAGGDTWRQMVKLKEGIAKDQAKQLVKVIKETKLKVQPSVQGDVIRVTGKKRDELQAAIAALKEKDLDLPLRYTNFRD